MKQNEKVIPIALTIVIGIVLQLLFIVSDRKDTPTRAVVRFTEAYVKGDTALENFVCEESRFVDDVDVVDNYLAAKAETAGKRGLSPFYLRDKLYNVRTFRVTGDDNKVEMRLTAEIKPPLKAFFTKEKARPFDHTFVLVNVDGTWKVCGSVFDDLAQQL